MGRNGWREGGRERMFEPREGRREGGRVRRTFCLEDEGREAGGGDGPFVSDQVELGQPFLLLCFG